jgi:tetratricopeptide (TPR) repeat protein
MQAELSERENLLDEVVTSYLRAVGAGQTPDRQELLVRYPHLAAELQEFFDDQDQMQELAAPLRAIAPAPVEKVLAALGDFRLIREVGRGGMGIVYEAEQISLRRRVALKVLPLAGMMDPRHLQRFQNEAQAAASLQHTNIVPVYYVGSERGVHYYAMQFIDGRDLASVIAQLREQALGPKPDPRLVETVDAADAQPVSPVSPVAVDTRPIAGLSTQGSTRSSEYFRTVAQLGIQAAEALDHAHQMGIVHRDIKPANLLVDAAGRLWVTDFGLAQFQSDSRLTMTGDLVGTLRYMSPEQALAKRVVVDHRTDIYSLGATLYEMLTLEPPFAGKDRQELLRQIAFEEPRAPRRLSKAIPAELETIALKALEKNPAERYATARALADDLRCFLEEKPIRAKPPTPVQWMRKWVRRHRAGVAAVASVLLLSLTILAASVGWLARDYAGRRTETEHAVAAALADSSAWQEQRRLPEALSAARRAVGVADGGTADAGLRRRVHARLADLELLERLENIRLEILTAIAKEGYLDWEATDAIYGQTFRQAGLDVESLPAEEAAHYVRQSTVPVELAAVLDHWAMVRWARTTGDDPSWKALLRVARFADGDHWRTRVREALEKRDHPALWEIAASEEVIGCPAATLSVLGIVLIQNDKDARGPTEVFLREAQQRHPNDFWLNDNLRWFFSAMRPNRPEEAVRFATVAVALRPGSPLAHVNLGNALKDKGRVADAIAEYKQALALDPKSAPAHNNLGNVLTDNGRGDEAIAEYKRAIDSNATFAMAHDNLGTVLLRQRRVDDAIAEFTKAIECNPKYASAYDNLGNALKEKGRMDDAMAAFKQALGLDPKCASAHNGLGFGLAAQGRLDNAIAEFKLAIDSDPTYAPAHNNLGNALAAQGRLDDAIAEFKLAIASDPKYAAAHSNLGNALADKGRLDDAIVQYKQAIDSDPKFAPGHYNLGRALKDKGRLDDAIAEFKLAIDSDPTYAPAHNSLGFALAAQGRLDDAIAEYKQATDNDPKFAAYHYNLGNALKGKGWLDDAIAHYEEAISLKEDYAEAHCNLGLALSDQGRFADALLRLRRGHELGSRKPRWPYPSVQWLQQCERLLSLDGKLPAILSGETEPVDTAERLSLAQLCQMACKKHYAAAQRFYSEAFAAEPKLAEDLIAQHRYNAACSAALAGCGQGEEADKLDEKERARLRRQALDWLRADLKVYRRDLEKIPDKAGGAATQRMQHWLQDNDLAGVRDGDALGKLPEAEHEDWQKLWQEVEALRQRAAKPPEGTGPGRP